jgi:hypothetical protein
VLVGVSFLGLLVYGGTGDQQPKKACQRVPPPDDKGKQNVPDDWCPPSLAEKTKGLQARFGPGLGEGTRTVIVRQAQESLGVGPKPGKDVRIAKLRLVSGGFALVKGPDKSVACLCGAGAPIPANLRDQCDGGWRDGHQGKSVCQQGFDRGSIPIGPEGAALSFPPTGQVVEVEVK